MWRLYLNTAMRREAAVDVGDTVVVEVGLGVSNVRAANDVDGLFDCFEISLP
jgi:hypothetical protein